MAKSFLVNAVLENITACEALTAGLVSVGYTVKLPYGSNTTRALVPGEISSLVVIDVASTANDHAATTLLASARKILTERQFRWHGIVVNSGDGYPAWEGSNFKDEVAVRPTAPVSPGTKGKASASTSALDRAGRIGDDES